MLSGQVGVTQTSQEGQLSEPGRLASQGPLPFLIWASGVRQPLISCQRLALCTPSRTCHRVPGFMPELQKECVKPAEPQSVTCKCKTFSRLRGKHAGDFIRTNGQWPQKWHWDPGAWPDEWKESTRFYSVNDEDPQSARGAGEDRSLEGFRLVNGTLRTRWPHTAQHLQFCARANDRSRQKTE